MEMELPSSAPSLSGFLDLGRNMPCILVLVIVQSRAYYIVGLASVHQFSFGLFTYLKAKFGYEELFYIEFILELNLEALLSIPNIWLADRNGFTSFAIGQNKPRQAEPVLC